jgi:uncharacterized protein
MEYQEIVKFLLNRENYQHPVKKVKHIDTHYLSDVFLTGKFAYKIKKPVNFGYLDFTTLAKRKFFCYQELILNRRLAPEMYLDVLPITNQNGQLEFDGQGEPVEYVLKMKEIPQQYLMDKLLGENKITKQILDKLAQIVAKFHARAKTSKKISFFGSLKIINKNWQENFSQSKPFISKTISLADWKFFKRAIEKFIKQNKKIFDQRIKEKKIKDCHGDLHKGNIFVAPEKIYVFDCIDFNERFRYQDIISEIAYFAMEMDFAGKKELSSYFVDQYFKSSKDQRLMKLLLFYKCYRAYIRGKVGGFSLNNPDLSKKQKEINKVKAQQYFQLAKKYVIEMQKPVLILGAGLPGIGRSTRLKLLAKKINAQILDSDLIRKQIKKIEYNPKSKLAVYQAMLKMAEKYLRQGKNVILDATFSKKIYRQLAIDLTQKLKIQYYLIEFFVSENIAKQRLIKRAKEKSASEADWQVYLKIKKEFEPIQDKNYFKINTAGLPAEKVKEILEKLGF